MSVREFSDLLTEYRATAVREEPRDFAPPEQVVVVPEFTCYGRKLSSSERIAAGVEAARVSYKVYADAPVHPELTEAIELRLAEPDGTGLGTFNTRSVIEYPSENLALIEADRLSTA